MDHRDNKRQTTVETRFETALHEAHELFEAVAGGPLILDPAWLDPVIAEDPRGQIAAETSEDHP